MYAAVQVQGQVADLTDLQRILQRSDQKLSSAQQQNMTVCCCDMLLLLQSCADCANLAFAQSKLINLAQRYNRTTARHYQNSVILQRWAVYTAANMLTKYSKEYQALQQAMQQRASIDKCVAAIEQS